MTPRAKNIAYWITTILVAFFIGIGGVTQMAILRGNAATQLLGYPLYFFHILGFWKVFGTIAVLVPRYTAYDFCVLLEQYRRKRVRESRLFNQAR
jgi:DoxX-like protein